MSMFLVPIVFGSDVPFADAKSFTVLSLTCLTTCCACVLATAHSIATPATRLLILFMGVMII